MCILQVLFFALQVVAVKLTNAIHCNVYLSFVTSKLTKPPFQAVIILEQDSMGSLSTEVVFQPHPAFTATKIKASQDNWNLVSDILTCTLVTDMMKQLIATAVVAVIIIHFNNNAQNSYRDKIAKGLEKVLLRLWKPNSSGTLAMNTYYRMHWKWPTLGNAIRLNQRIFIFMDNNLSQHIHAMTGSSEVTASQRRAGTPTQ